MSTKNPFSRGYSDFEITRLLAIDYGSEFPLAYRKLHPSFDKKTDNYVTSHSFCLFNDDYAYLLNDDTAEFANEHASDSGQVRSVFYQLTAKDKNHVHLGDFLTRESAHAASKQLAFDNGFFSRCWEISSSHVSGSDYSWLKENMSAILPLISCFEIDFSCMGLRLSCTPWSDENLRMAYGYDSVSKLRSAMAEAGFSEPLIDLLFLAANANVRFLILDSDASTLDGLPVFDW